MVWRVCERPTVGCTFEKDHDSAANAIPWRAAHPSLSFGWSNNNNNGLFLSLSSTYIHTCVGEKAQQDTYIHSTARWRRQDISYTTQQQQQAWQSFRPNPCRIADDSIIHHYDTTTVIRVVLEHPPVLSVLVYCSILDGFLSIYYSA